MPRATKTANVTIHRVFEPDRERCVAALLLLLTRQREGLTASGEGARDA